MAFAFVDNETIVQYPIGRVDIQRKFSNVSFPTDLEERDLSAFGVVKVLTTAQPSIDITQESLEEATPIFEDGAWHQAWNIIPLPEQEKQWHQEAQSIAVRDRRNQLLSECDWTQLSDAPVNSSLWAAYRQELRDVPSQFGFPREVNWPEKPIV